MAKALAMRPTDAGRNAIWLTWLLVINAGVIQDYDFIALNELGIERFVAGETKQALAALRSSLALAPRGEPVPALNLLWLEAIESQSSGEVSTSMREAAAVVEIATKTACLGSLHGQQAKSLLSAQASFRDGSSVSVETVDGRFVVEPRMQRYSNLTAIADLELGRELCDFPGTDTSLIKLSAAELYVDAVKRYVVGYDASRPWDIDFERVSSGGAARWNDQDKRSVSSFAHVGSLSAFQASVRATLNVPGDVAECGVFRGGTALVAAATLQAYDPQGTRSVWAFDTFAGVPTSDEVTANWPTRSYSASRNTVITNFIRFGLERRLRTYKGPFDPNLPRHKGPAQLAVLRVDADTFSGTLDALNMLYDRLQPGGIVIVDDYHLGGCRRAVRLFRQHRNISAPLLPVPLDYILGCPITSQHQRQRCGDLAADILYTVTAASASPPRVPRVARNPMLVAQNVYWRRPPRAQLARIPIEAQ